MDVRFATREVTPEMVLENYAKGLFPMGNPGFGIVTWHCPNPRAIIPLDGFHISRSLARTLRQAHFRVSFDEAYNQVIRACGEREEREPDRREKSAAAAGDPGRFHGRAS